MTRDERITQIRQHVGPLRMGESDDGAWERDSIRFLLAELDAARAREAKLREALKDLSIRLRPNVEAAPWVTTRIAALAEGEDTRGSAEDK